MKTLIKSLSIDSVCRKLGVQSPNNDFLVTRNIYPAIDYKLLRPQFYSIAYCYGGSYRVKLDLKEYLLEPGQVMFFKPNETHHLLEIKDYQGYLISFTSNFFTSRTNTDLNVLVQPFFENHANNLLPLEKKELKSIRFYFKALYKKNQEISSPHKYRIMRGLLMALLFELNTLFCKQPVAEIAPSSRADSIYQQFMQNLVLHYKDKRDVKFYAEQLHITPGYLSEVVKEKTGKSARDIIHEMVLLEAKILLQHSNETIENIAAMLNFSDITSFSRFFKIQTGGSPSRFRLSV